MSNFPSPSNSQPIPSGLLTRQLALQALQAVQQGRYADEALHRVLQRSSLDGRDRNLVTELVYGTVRQQRTLDALIDQLARKPAQQQPINLRLILQLGLYQLRYLDHIPARAVVDTAVELAKRTGLKPLAGVINGLLRNYARLSHPEPDGTSPATIPTEVASGDPLVLPTDPIAQLGVRYSFPDWIVQVWVEALGLEQAEHLCQWMNRPPHIDLRVNIRRQSVAAVTAAFEAAGIAVQPIPALPQALRLVNHAGAIADLPGFAEGWWTVQDASAQLVSHLVDPQPGQWVIDACAAPGGKATHLAELMGDTGEIWACDRNSKRLQKLHQSIERLQLKTIHTCVGDSSHHQEQFQEQADAVLVDAPCSGLGTLHRHADARWRQTPDRVRELAHLQQALLAQTATWVKTGGSLIYATCTLHPAENEAVVRAFLSQHPNWQIHPPAPRSPAAPFASPEGWVKVWPHQHDMDGFFMVQLRRSPPG